MRALSLSLTRFRSLSLAVLFSKGASLYTYNAGETNMFWKHHPTSERPEPKETHTTQNEWNVHGLAWQGTARHGGSSQYVRKKERHDNRNVQATGETRIRICPAITIGKQHNRQNEKEEENEERKKTMQKETGLTYHTIFDESVLYFISINKISLRFSCFSIRCFATQFSLYARVCVILCSLCSLNEKKSILCIYIYALAVLFWYNCLCSVSVSISCVLSHSYTAQPFYRFDLFSLFLVCIAYNFIHTYITIKNLIVCRVVN